MDRHQRLFVHSLFLLFFLGSSLFFLFFSLFFYPAQGLFIASLFVLLLFLLGLLLAKNIFQEYASLFLRTSFSHAAFSLALFYLVFVLVFCSYFFFSSAQFSFEQDAPLSFSSSTKSFYINSSQFSEDHFSLKIDDVLFRDADADGFLEKGEQIFVFVRLNDFSLVSLKDVTLILRGHFGVQSLHYAFAKDASVSKYLSSQVSGSSVYREGFVRLDDSVALRFVYGGEGVSRSLRKGDVLDFFLQASDGSYSLKSVRFE